MEPITKLLNFGLINIDKPAGPTSFSVSEFVKRQLKLKKTSHMGTLDPKVTGVLPITLGRACKLAGYFIRHDKKYIGVLETHTIQDINELQKLINKNFSGEILQTPPHRSAVKREERKRTVYNWTLIEESEDKRSFLFECYVEGGTYIRKLCSDLGDMIGGAHMGELRRTEAGIFNEKGIIKLDKFETAIKEWKEGSDVKLRKMIIPAEECIKKVLPVVEVNKSAINSLYVGRPLLSIDISKQDMKLKNGDNFAVFFKDIFIGVYRKTNEDGIFGRSEFVFN